MEREALEEACDEVVAAQENADRLERLTTKRDQASRRRAAELAARKEQLARREQQVASREEAASEREEAMRFAQADLCRQNDDLEHGRADLLHREEQVALREMEADLASSALAAWEEQVARREVDADLASSALTAREEHVANQEVDLTAREQAMKARAEQLEQTRIEAAARLEQVRAAKGVPAITTDSSSLETRLKNAEEELDTVFQEWINVKLMMWDILRQARDFVEAAGLRCVSVGSQGLEMETIGHLALGFSEIARRLNALSAVVQELATREECALAQSVAEHILASYSSRDPAFPLEPARQGVVEVEEAAALAAVRDVATVVAESFLREPGPSSDSSRKACPPP
ncbi:uncharacterized protein LOC133925402 [Phragmites australis]|uniref:uncharacterized protein LOC133925402 n=1 Tax=Phragmites australis TaxID=29695 RepID=UPI002D783EFB|nr:uncharacterized protein LOC133925402 [Phragmites australis]